MWATLVWYLLNFPTSEQRCCDLWKRTTLVIWRIYLIFLSLKVSNTGVIPTFLFVQIILVHYLKLAFLDTVWASVLGLLLLVLLLLLLLFCFFWVVVLVILLLFLLLGERVCVCGICVCVCVCVWVWVCGCVCVCMCLSVSVCLCLCVFLFARSMNRQNSRRVPL